jgi:putative membrane protein
MGMRIAVLIAAGGAHSFLGKLLYAHAPTLPPGSGHSAGEIELAAQWMYYGGHVADLLLLTGLFTAWYHRTGRRLDAARSYPPRHQGRSRDGRVRG